MRLGSVGDANIVGEVGEKFGAIWTVKRIDCTHEDEDEGMNELENALQAHQAALNTQRDMRDAAKRRDQAIRNAINAGHTTAEIAQHLGVSIRRIQAMAQSKETK